MGKKSGYRPLRASTIRSILANNPSVKVAADGNEMYKKLREIRRNRRQCKNEMDLLELAYTFFKTQATELTTQLSAVQGKCKQLKAGIDGRQYTLRTGVIQ